MIFKTSPPLNVDQLIAELTKWRTVETQAIGSGQKYRHVVGVEKPQFEAPQFDPLLAQMGIDQPYHPRFGGLEVIVDPNIKPLPCMQVSKKFAELQHPDLVRETNKWMASFFGYYDPVYVFDSRASMKPETMALLKRRINDPGNY